MLAHDFDDRDCTAVAFRTYFFNHGSRRVIQLRGTSPDGVLSHRQINRHPQVWGAVQEGAVQETVVYNAAAAQWLALRAHRDHQLGATGLA